MTFKQLRIFSAAAKFGNITRASQELRVSQPAASKQLKLLEDEYQTRLFVRVGRGVELTDAGKTFLSNANALLVPLEDLKQNLNNPRPSVKTESLAIGGSHSSSASFLPTLLAIFQKSHPNVPVILRTNQSRALEKLLLRSQLEIAVVTKPPRSPYLKAESYRHEKLVAFVPANHPLTKKRQLSLQELLRHPLVVRGGGKEGKTTAEKVLNEISGGLRPNVVMRCESPVALKASVQSGLGIGILFEDLVSSDIRDGRFRSLRLADSRLESKSYLIYHGTRPLSANAQDFLSLLRQSRDLDTRSFSKKRIARLGLPGKFAGLSFFIDFSGILQTLLEGCGLTA
jgi:DNA-binding transcriptional LysR family regulator